MCGLFPCIPILEVFIFYFFNEKYIAGWGFKFYYVPCPGALQYTLLTYDVFLVIYLSIFVAVVVVGFPLFNDFKRRNQRFPKAVIL